MFVARTAEATGQDSATRPRRATARERRSPTRRLVCVASTAALVLATAVAAGPAGAESPRPPAGRLSTKSGVPVAAGSAISVRFGEASEASRRLAPVIAELLSERGFAVGADAPLTLEVDVEAKVREERDAGVTIRGRAGSQSTKRLQPQVKLPLRRDRRRSMGTRLAVQMSLTGVREGFMWAGSATYVAIGGDRQTIHEKLAERLLDALGKTVDERFDLD